MADSFFFYDLETSGFNPRDDRVMQFAGQRTDLDLNPIGEPYNILIALSDDILPSPDAILVTGITPQQTKADGLTEADFLKVFNEEVATPGTIFIGFNSVRFDDEFMRCLHYRNFYDPYIWQWKDGRSRWDLLDVVRMTRALRPDGIKWPKDADGNPSNKLELLTGINGLDHTKAHDALNDVLATISLAQLIRQKQPKLFDYLLSMREKQPIRKLANSGKPFVYSSGKYPSEFEKTTVVKMIAENDHNSGALVYDLRYDPTPFAKMSAKELADAWRWIKPEERSPKNLRLPIKTMKYNRCPAIAPLAVLDEDSKKRLKIDLKIIKQNEVKLASISDWPAKILDTLKILDGEQLKRFTQKDPHVDGQIYDGFMGNEDSLMMSRIRSAKPDKLSEYIEHCQDKRLKKLLPLYKARNFSRDLTPEEREQWEEYRSDKLLKGGQDSKLAKYFQRIEELSKQTKLTDIQRYVLEDLKLYGESLLP